MSTFSSTLRRIVGVFAVLAAVLAATYPIRSADKRIVLIAGRPSHPPGMHEFRAGSLLLQKALSGFPAITVRSTTMGWPTKEVDGQRVDDNSALDNADAVLILCRRRQGQPGDPG